MLNNDDLTPEEWETYSWQIPVHEFGEAGQRRLKASSVLVSRCGGLGGVAAQELAASGIGRLVLAHGGRLKPSDLNRQILMNHAGLGEPRVELAADRLRALNPNLRIDAFNENVTEENAERLVGMVDLVVDAAPLFEERYALNRQCVLQRKPMIECAVNELEGHLTTVLPGSTPCLACLYPEKNERWKRRFPVFGAVAAVAGSLAAMEAVKVLTGLGNPLYGKLLQFDLRSMTFRKFKLHRPKECSVCGGGG